jgi:hypothetical protein
MLILAVMLPGQALAAAGTEPWVITPGGSDECEFSAGHTTCFVDFDHADDLSEMMDMRTCENYSFHWNAIITAETHTNTVNVRWSVLPTAGVNTSTIVNNATLTGDPATDLDVLAGYDAAWVYVDSVVWAAAGTGRGVLQCWKRAE